MQSAVYCPTASTALFIQGLLLRLSGWSGWEVSVLLPKVPLNSDLPYFSRKLMQHNKENSRTCCSTRNKKIRGMHFILFCLFDLHIHSSFSFRQCSLLVVSVSLKLATSASGPTPSEETKILLTVTERGSRPM